MKIAIGCDHGGYALKQKIIDYLDAHSLDYRDFGCYSTDSCDYPLFAQAAAQAFLDYLTTDEAMAVFETVGFSPVA